MARVRVLLDMDEVLVDFVGGALRAWGSTYQACLPHWQPGVWGCIPALSKALGYPADAPLIDEQFWQLLDGLGEDFWFNLKTHPWTDEVLCMASRVTDDWHIISSPSHHPSCYTGKVRWLKQFFGPTFDRFALTPHKEIFARHDVILIDDSDANVQKFRRAGGKAVLFPRYNNSLHRIADKDRLTYVKHALAVCFGDIQDEQRASQAMLSHSMR